MILNTDWCWLRDEKASSAEIATSLGSIRTHATSYRTRATPVKQFNLTTEVLRVRFRGSQVCFGCLDILCFDHQNSLRLAEPSFTSLPSSPSTVCPAPPSNTRNPAE